jgi:hypothetical protein
MWIFFTKCSIYIDHLFAVRNQDVAAYNGSYKKAQRHSEGNGKGYLCSRFLYVIESEWDP